MDAAQDESYNLRMEIPAGYKVEELPKPTRVKLNENEGMFEYLVSSDASVIQLRSSIKEQGQLCYRRLSKPSRLFCFHCKKHSEQIVLKKIK